MARSLIKQLQRREARRAIGASTVRGQGVAGVVAAARAHLERIPLRRFSVERKSTFDRHLDVQTGRLVSDLPKGARSWGVARKALNIFLRHCLYNTYLRDHYGLAASELWYEVPLDSLVARAIRDRFPRSVLPRWPGVRYLTRGHSEIYQEAASVIADNWGIARVHLDAYFWVDRD